MCDYIQKMMEDFHEDYKLGVTAETPSTTNLFAWGSGEELQGKKQKNFHTFVATGLFGCK